MMVRAVVALLLSSLLLLSADAANLTLGASSPSLGAVGDLLRFSLQTMQAPWPGRRMAIVRQLPGSVTFRTSDAGRSMSLSNPMMLVGGFDPRVELRRVQRHLAVVQRQAVSAAPHHLTALRYAR